MSYLPQKVTHSPSLMGWAFPHSFDRSFFLASTCKCKQSTSVPHQALNINAGNKSLVCQARLLLGQRNTEHVLKNWGFPGFQWLPSAGHCRQPVLGLHQNFILVCLHYYNWMELCQWVGVNNDSLRMILD